MSDSTLNKTSKASFLTCSGKSFDLADPQIKSVCLEDVAQGLAKQCRYNGQIPVFYSIAQHSVLVAEEVKRKAKALGLTGSTVRSISLMGLLHDAAEAYCGDCISPLKHLLSPRFQQIEDKIQQTVLKALHVKWLPEYEYLVDAVDKGMFVRECLDFRGATMDWAKNIMVSDMTEWLPPAPIDRALDWHDARVLFLDAYWRMWGDLLP